ncbi:hypothetical protein BGX29_009765 [Mortierella sp. GBA35]|nr:hypothetical protein BGX29_009765 [Mortierella sp. GBA35]
MQSHQQGYAPSNQFQEGHANPTDSSDWNAYMKPSTASVSSVQSWVSTGPSSSNYTNQYSQSQQQSAHYSPHQSHVPPPRGSSAQGVRNRSNSNNSTASGAGMGYGHGGYTGSHLSHVSQMSNNSSVYSHSQQQQHYQPQQNQQYQDLSSFQPASSFNSTNSNGSAQQGYPSYDTQHANESTLSMGNNVYADNHTFNYQQQQTLYPPPPSQQHQQQHQRTYRSTPSDVSHISVGRPYQQESLTAQSQLLMQSIEQVGLNQQQGSPRMAHRSVPKRREQGQATANMTADGDLPSLDQYEAMLEKMASPTLGPSNPRETRSNLRRTEHDRESRAARQVRKQQPQQQQPMSMDPMLHSGGLAPPPPALMIVEDPSSANRTGLGHQLKVSSAEERKLRRRSSLPTSLVDTPSRLLTDLRRRNSGHHSPMDSPSPASTLQVHPLDHPFGHRQTDLDYNQDSSAYESRRFLHVDEDDDNLSVISDLDQQRRNKRKSPRLSQLGAKPPLTTKSQLRLSHTLSQTDVDEVNMLASSGAKDGDLEMASVAAMVTELKTDEGDRQIEQFQWELQQLQQGNSIPRNLASPKPSHGTHSSPRSRATTPLGIVAEECGPMPPGPSRQQLLTSLEDGGPKPIPNRATSPILMKSRPTTPVSGIRPPPGPAPPMMSAPISGTGAYPSPPPSATAPSNPASRKGQRDPTRRAKPSPPVSTNIMPPTTPRQRTGSIVIADGLLTQAPLSMPLPSLPPPPPPSAGPRSTASNSSDSAAAQRRRKPSGGRDLVQPSAQLLSEYTFGQGQDSLPTPAPSLSMTPDIGSNGPSPSLLEKERELSGAKDEIQRLQALLAEQDKDAAAALEARQELETKLGAMMAKKLQEEGNDNHRTSGSSLNSTPASGQHEELEQMRQERTVQQESHAALQQELGIFTERLQQEEAQYRTLQDTVQRLTVKISRLEAQHAAEVQQIQQDHEEFLEKVVQDHANALTDLSEQSKSESEKLRLRLRQEQQEQHDHAAEKDLGREQATLRAREKVLMGRLDEQVDRNQQLEARIFELERKQGEHDFEMDSWIKTNKSLERQLAIEQLQQQENQYRIEKAEQENRRLRAILADLDLAARINRTAEQQGQDEEEEDRDHARSLYERQRQKWMDQTQLLERKMVKAEEEATAIMEKNMELMVSLEMIQ